MFEGQPDEVRHALQAVMRERRGPIKPLVGELIFENPYFQMTRTSFQFETPGGAKFRYNLGEHLSLEMPDAALEAECALYKWGTVYGAVAWLNRLPVLHASCMTDGISASAITAQSGVGKSTLAAAMGALGLRQICDDTLVLSEADGRSYAVPDLKPAKLSKEVIKYLGLAAGDEVPFSEGKRYVLPTKLENDCVPLTNLVELERGDELRISPIVGSKKLELIATSFYRPFIHSALHDSTYHSKLMLDLAQRLACYRMTIPSDLSAITDYAAKLKEWLELKDNAKLQI